MIVSRILNQEVSYCVQTIPSFLASTMRVLGKQKLLKWNNLWVSIETSVLLVDINIKRELLFLIDNALYFSPEITLRVSHLWLFLWFSPWLFDMHWLLRLIQLKINILCSTTFIYILFWQSKLSIIIHFNQADSPYVWYEMPPWAYCFWLSMAYS